LRYEIHLRERVGASSGTQWVVFVENQRQSPHIWKTGKRYKNFHPYAWEYITQNRVVKTSPKNGGTERKRFGLRKFHRRIIRMERIPNRKTSSAAKPGGVLYFSAHRHLFHGQFTPPDSYLISSYIPFGAKSL